MSRFKYSVGPWSVHEGADAYGPAVRETIPFEEKIKTFKEIGFDAIQFHDDDAVPNINDYTEAEIIEKAKEVKALLDKYDLAAEFVAPRLWFDPHTTDGGFCSNCAEDREYAMWRAYRSIDIAKVLGCDKIVLWLAREGTLCYESKSPVEATNRLVDAINKMLDYDKDIKILFTGLRPGEKLYEEVLSDKENTKATPHPKINVANVREYAYSDVAPRISKLIEYSYDVKVEAMVKEMKSIVPEFKSKNSDFEKYDK